ncbi:isopentenyl-diphosphate delta-isomerase [Rhynchospora pubera]|uniref:Isopentenyl-diphosphate delta-isomerase n=1 Tax=Rhynchospora pubera TaxID=906938 RepID=A0AAV8D2S0_9POAL|nr:isopentenyl-diphosphate delta-isomerase [Rhynchospora pubera]
MAGIALLLDLAKRNPSLSSSAKSLHAHTLISAAAAASAAAASYAAGLPLSSRFLFGDGGFSVAYCDAGATAVWGDTSLQSSVKKGPLDITTKEYILDVKPLFSAFQPKNLAMTSLRSFLLFYLPLLEPRTPTEEEDDVDEPHERERPVDLVTPFQNSIKQILRETAVVTTRRVLERVAVHYVSRRTAWKLLKDASRSARRKAARGMPTILYVHSVGKTTLKAQVLGVSASWVVQAIIDVYRCFIRKPEDEIEEVELKEKFKQFRKKLHTTTIKCGASLVLASVGAGIGALIHPSHGQWIGCTIGDFAGPIAAILVIEKLQLNL